MIQRLEDYGLLGINSPHRLTSPYRDGTSLRIQDAPGLDRRLHNTKKILKLDNPARAAAVPSQLVTGKGSALKQSFAPRSRRPGDRFETGAKGPEIPRLGSREFRG